MPSIPAIATGSVIEVSMGADKGRIGIVIGCRVGIHSGDTILVVFFQDNKLDVCVLPEMVRVLSTPNPANIAWLTNYEMQHLHVCD